MVRPSKNWERLVRATLRREKLRHDGSGGHKRAPIGIACFVPLSLTRETNIDLILPAAYEIQSVDPNVAFIRKGLVPLEILQLCHPKRLGFSAFVSCCPSPLDTTQLWTSWVTMNAFESSLSPLSLIHSRYSLLLCDWFLFYEFSLISKPTRKIQIKRTKLKNKSTFMATAASYNIEWVEESHASPVPVTVVKKTPQSESSVNNEHLQCYERLRDEVTELVWFLKSTTIGNKLLNDALKWMKQENAT